MGKAGSYGYVLLTESAKREKSRHYCTKGAPGNQILHTVLHLLSGGTAMLRKNFIFYAFRRKVEIFQRDFTLVFAKVITWTVIHNTIHIFDNIIDNILREELIYYIRLFADII